MRPITAADLMNPHVLTVREDLTVQELASFLLRHQITGAPVEDAAGRLVGVVSVSDIAEASLLDPSDAVDGYAGGSAGTGGGAAARRMARPQLVGFAGAAPGKQESARTGGKQPDPGEPEPGEQDLGEQEPGEQEELTVRDIMTPAVVSVAEDATVSEVASKMLDGHVHRLLVTRDGQPLGIITTSDLLGLLIDER